MNPNEVVINLLSRLHEAVNEHVEFIKAVAEMRELQSKQQRCLEGQYIAAQEYSRMIYLEKQVDNFIRGSNENM